MSKRRRPEGVTRQGVRDLNLIGPKPANKRTALPPMSLRSGDCKRCGSPFARGCDCEERDMRPEDVRR